MLWCCCRSEAERPDADWVSALETGGTDETNDAASLCRMKTDVDFRSVAVSRAVLPAADKTETPAITHKRVDSHEKTQKTLNEKYCMLLTASVHNKTHRTKLHRTVSIH